MKCIICNSYNFNEYDEEIICETCGASYGLKYLGYYSEGSDERIDEGFEDEKWKNKWRSWR